MSEQPIQHPSLEVIRNQFKDAGLKATEFRGDLTIIVSVGMYHEVARFLRDAPELDYDFLSDVIGIDYLDYPAETIGRFAVVLQLASTRTDLRIGLKTFVDPSMDTTGNEIDPALVVPSVTDIWPGAEWREREVFDMFGISFKNHPDLRRILTWKDFPGFPLRKDYPLRGRGERESYRPIDRDSS